MYRLHEKGSRVKDLQNEKWHIYTQTHTEESYFVKITLNEIIQRLLSMTETLRPPFPV